MSETGTDEKIPMNRVEAELMIAVIQTALVARGLHDVTRRLVRELEDNDQSLHLTWVKSLLFTNSENLGDLVKTIDRLIDVFGVEK